MKRILTAMLMAFALTAAFSCDNQENDQATAEIISVKESSLAIPAAGGSATIEFVTDYPFDVTVDKSWCTVSVEGKVATFTADANDEYESRYAGVSVKCEGKTLNFTVHQFGFYSTGFAPEDISASASAASFDFPYESDTKLVATTDADWITLTVTEDNLHVALAENPAVSDQNSTSRSAEINWQLGHDKGVIAVVQRNRSFMHVDSNWNVRYLGDQNVQNQTVSVIYNAVADSTISGKYSTYYVAKSAFTQSGDVMDDFVLTVAQSVKEELETMLAYYQQHGYPNLTFADLLHESSGYDAFNQIKDGSYIAFAIGFTDDAAVTGHYAYSEFTIGGGSSASGYDAWLGQWSVTRGSETDTWTIAKQTEGQSYTITGIEGTNIPVPAAYESGQLVLYCQEGLATVSTQNYGDCTVGIYGVWGDSNFASGNYAIFTGTISGSKATLSAGQVSFEDGSSYDLDSFMFIGENAKGQYVGFSEVATPLPVTITKIGGGSDNPGGGDDSGEASEGYKKWLGNWSVDSGAFTITLSQTKVNQQYGMLGWHRTADFFTPSPVLYNAEDGSIVLYASDSEPVATNVDVGVEEGACNLYLVGRFIYSDGKEYYITSGGQGWYDVATGTLQSDSSVQFTGNSFEVSQGGSFTFCRLDLMAKPISSSNVSYSFQNKPNTFPLSAVRASTSSVRKMDLSAGTWVKSDIGTLEMKKPAAGTVNVYRRYTAHQAVPALRSVFAPKKFSK